MATCQCKNGHTWTTRVLEDDPSTNSTTVEDTVCPECGSDDFEIVEDAYEDDLDHGE
jgi:hypothetical protein